MPIVSKPASIEKNAVAEFTLDKTVLAAVASVAADSYFSDSTKWSEVIIHYKSSEGNQREVLKFDATQASPTANFLVSDKARDIFEVQKIVIKDFDNGSFVVERSELVAAEFDVDMSTGQSGGGISLTWNSDAPSVNYLATSSSVEKLSASGWDLNVVSDQTLTGDMFIEARVATFPKNMIIGFQNGNANSGASLTQINYGLYCDPGSGGWLRFFYKTADSYSFPLLSGISENDIIKISIEGGALGTIKVYKNGTQIYTESVSTFVSASGLPYSEPYRIGVALYEAGSKFDQINFGNI